MFIVSCPKCNEIDNIDLYRGIMHCEKCDETYKLEEVEFKYIEDESEIENLKNN